MLKGNPMPLQRKAFFSTVYIEEGVSEHPITREVLSRLPRSRKIPIWRYQDVFHRSGQKTWVQKNGPSLVLASKPADFLYPGSEMVQPFGYKNFYYNSVILNCPFNCDYCYLQGMYPGGQCVIFVNEEDFFQATREAIATRPHPEQPLYLCLSYDTDLLGMEYLTGWNARWLNFLQEQPDLILESRTKSAPWAFLKSEEPDPRFILAWSFTLDSHDAPREKGTAPMPQRIKAAAEAQRRGWPIRLCFDPVFFVQDWKNLYLSLFKQIFSELNADAVLDASLGFFRMNPTYFKKAARANPMAPVFHREYERADGMVSEAAHQRQEMAETLSKMLLAWIPQEKLYLWT